MNKKKDILNHVYAEFQWVEKCINSRYQDLQIPHTIQVYRWNSGELTISADGRQFCVVEEKELLKAIQQLPKNPRNRMVDI